MSGVSLLLNQAVVSAQMPPTTPLLDFLRQDRHSTGCKEGCREGDCGACLVLLGKLEQGRVKYRPVAACLLPVAALVGCHLVTVEGLSGTSANPIQQALIEQGGIQCGYCTPGLVVALTAFFLNSTKADLPAAYDAAAGNLCRCTGYAGIKRAIGQLCRQFDLAGSPLEQRISDCISWGLLPSYFADAADRLLALPSNPQPVSSGQQGQSPVAGATDWLLQQAAVNPLPEPHFLAESTHGQAVQLHGSRCRIAATARLAQLEYDPILQALLPGIDQDLKLVCSAPIRQQATVGGNLANASPIADLAVMLLALNVQLNLEGLDGRRRLPLREFFLAYKQTALQAGEIIVDIDFEIERVADGFSFEKVGKRRHLDIASVNSAMSVRLDGQRIAEAHLAAGGVAPQPLYLTATCDYLRGKPLQANTVLAAAAIAQTEIAPISDLRGSADYKRLLFRQLLFAHFMKLFPEQIRWEALRAYG